ncbi:MAG: hypothetical protein IT573_12075, partial [Deltaproteobacteria bacterium]|nr:hypothetical protein [Deltaproteobacteria bacterium]
MGAFLLVAFQARPARAGTICFCHATGSISNPFNTICTSNAGQQNGHTSHGDPDFGCGCGDNVCDPSDGETCGTCPQDCGACPACGDGNADEGEECGDPGTSPGTCTAPETCEGCRCVPPPPVCGNNDQELGEECDGTDNAACGNLGCTDQCECKRCGNGTVDSGEQCDNPNDPCCNADCTFNTGNECDDGQFCTENDACNGGACNGSPKTCDDGVQCTVDSCNETSDQCENPTSSCECRTDADCGDGNACTDEYCDTGTFTCVRADNSNPCDDGLFCNGKDTCGSGTCSVHAGDPCAAGGECADSCNEEKDSCNDPAGTVCKDDGNVCTDNECNGSGECVPTNN